MNRSLISMNNTEQLRKMSNPIPINSAWQMRSPQSFANIDDSTQFDPGIPPDQCISQSSISPSSAASYSLSPTQAIYNTNNSIFLNQQQVQQQHQHHQMINNQQMINHYSNSNILTVNLEPFNSLDLVVTSSNQNSSGGFTVVDSTFATHLDESNSSTTNQAIDLESLLVNTTLSDTTNNIFLHHNNHADEDPNSEDTNNMINPMFLFNNSFNKFNSGVDLNNNSSSTTTTTTMTNTTSNIVPSSESNKIRNILQQQQLQKQQNEKLNKYLVTQSPSPPLSSSSSSSSTASSHNNSSSNFVSQFNPNATFRQRKIVEEEEPSVQQQQQQQHIHQHQQLNHSFQQQIQQQQQYSLNQINFLSSGPMSLPATSYLDSNSFRFNTNTSNTNPILINNNNTSSTYQTTFNDNSFSSNSNNNSKQQQMSPLADPVLTQIQLNNNSNKTNNLKAQLIQQQHNNLEFSTQQQQQQTFQAKQNRKVNFLIQENQSNKQVQQQEQHQVSYFNPNNFLNTSNVGINMPMNNSNTNTTNAYLQQPSMSLPVYPSLFDYLKQNDNTNKKQQNDTLKSDEIKFSKLKISSPASSTSSASSNTNNNTNSTSSPSSSSTTSSAQQFLNLKTDIKQEQLDDSSVGGLVGDPSLMFDGEENDVLNALSTTSSSSNVNTTRQRNSNDDDDVEQNTDAFLNDLNQIVVLNLSQSNNNNSIKMEQLDVNSLVNSTNSQNHQSWNSELNSIQVDASLDDSLNLDVDDDQKLNAETEKEFIQLNRLNQQQQQHQQHQLQHLAEYEDEESGDDDDEDDYDEDEDDDEDDEDEDYEDEEEEDDEDEDEDLNEDDSNFAIQFDGDLALNTSNSSSSTRRRSNRVKSNTNISSSSSLTKILKAQQIKRRQLSSSNQAQLAASFSATPSIMFAQQQIQQQQQQSKQQLYVGSVGSSLTSMMRRSSNNQSRKQARTNVNSSGVDVHTSSQQQQQQPIQQINSSNTKNIFSNLTFSPFTNNFSNLNQQQTQQQIPSSNSNIQLQQQQQSQHSFLSISLPSTHKFDSMMLLKNNTNQSLVQPQQQVNLNFKPQQQQQNSLYGLLTSKTTPTPSTNQQQHPNLNKLLLNNNTATQLPPKQPANTKTTDKKRQQVKSEPPKQQKKRQQKKQDLFDDDDNELDSETEEEDDELLSDGDDMTKTSIKMEESDYDSDSTELNMSKSSKSTKPASASSSYANHESLFDLMMSSKNRDAYFWQYNIQSKGPKTKKVLTLRNKDPHLHRDFFDPVYQLQALNRGNAGNAVNKLRKGDGNDVTPNAEKLYNLGNQIRDFIQKSYQMNSACFSPPPSSSLSQLGTTPTNGNLLLSSSVDNSIGSQQPQPRVNLKREKNKIASRACRLKKKAQHEANKIKLSGLNEEHKQLIDCINSARELIRTKLTNPEKLPADKKMIELIDDQIKKKLKTKVAGNSDGFVHSLMLQVEKERQRLNKGGLFDLNNTNSFAHCSQQQQQTIKTEQIVQQQNFIYTNTNEAI